MRIKYKVHQTKTYATDTTSIPFSIEINGVKAKGFWSPTSKYTAEGVDVNNLYPDDGNYCTSNGMPISIFSNGGNRRSYEIFATPIKAEKQPKDLRFTGPYYAVANLRGVLIDKIKKGLEGTIDAKITNEFKTYFKID